MLHAIRFEAGSLSWKVLAAAFSFQLLLVFSVCLGFYLLAASFVLAGLILFVLNDLEKSLYLMVFSLAFSQSIPLFAVGGRTVGISLDYVLMPIIISGWILRKAFAEDAGVRTPTGFKTPAVAFMACCFISLAVASFRLDSSKMLDGILPFIAWIEYVLLGVVVADIVRSREQITRILFLMLLFATIIALTGIVEYLVFHSPRISSLFGSFFRNVRGNPNVLGAYLASFAMFSTCFLFALKGHKRALMMATTVILVTALILTLSRSAWLASVVAFSFIAIKKRRRSLLLLLPLVVVLLVAVSGDKIADRMESILEAVGSRELVKDFVNIDYRVVESGYLQVRGLPGYDTDVVAAVLRYSAWSNAIEIFTRHPVFGCGFLLNRYFGRLRTAENLYLEILAGAGALGLFAFLWMFARIVNFARTAWRRATSGLSAHFSLGYLAATIVIAMVSLTGSVFLSPKLLGTFSVLTGLLVSVSRTEGHRENHRRDE